VIASKVYRKITRRETRDYGPNSVRAVFYKIAPHWGCQPLPLCRTFAVSDRHRCAFVASKASRCSFDRPLRPQFQPHLFRSTQPSLILVVPRGPKGLIRGLEVSILRQSRRL